MSPGTGRFFYFAYGSNLDLSGKLMSWAPSASLVGPALAPRRRLSFTRRSTRWGARAADILPSRDAVTWGAIFAVDHSDLSGLDRCEGAPRNYRRIDLDVRLGDTSASATSYEVVDRHLPEAPPTPAYLERVLTGAHAVGLPTDWVEHLRELGAGRFGEYDVDLDLDLDLD